MGKFICQVIRHRLESAVACARVPRLKVVVFEFAEITISSINFSMCNNFITDFGSQTYDLLQWIILHRNKNHPFRSPQTHRPVFRVGDRVAIRRSNTLSTLLRTRILSLVGDVASPPLTLCLAASTPPTPRAPTPPRPGDILEPLSATPSVAVVSGCTFANSRASGVILQADHVRIERSLVANVSSAAIAVGGYWNSFSESPFGARYIHFMRPCSPMCARN